MSRLNNFKRQHREIRELADKISMILNQDLLVQDPMEVRNLLSTLSGKLMMHLAMEDQFLYPNLMESNDSQIQTTAARFSTEMGDLVKVFKDYSEKWLTPSSIKANPDTFIKDSHDIFQALLRRIEREDRELYPLVDQE